MGHNVCGFIATYEHLAANVTRLPVRLFCKLRGGFGLVPFEDDGNELAVQGAEFERFVKLTERLRRWAERESIRFAIAYVETDYCGGIGSQSAVLWRAGSVVLGPLHSGISVRPGKSVGELPINQVLRCIGVVAQKPLDEFDTIGLGLKRSTEDWVDHGGHSDS